MTGNKNSECITVPETMCVQTARHSKTIRASSVHVFKHLRIILSNNNRSWMYGATTNTGEWKEWACYSWKQHLESYPTARKHSKSNLFRGGYVRSKVVNSEIIISSSEMIQTLFFCLHTRIYWFPFWAENVEWSSSYNSMSHSPRVTVGVGPFLRAGISGFKSWLFHLIALQSSKMASQYLDFLLGKME